MSTVTAPNDGAATAESASTSLGLEENLEAALAYALGFVTGIALLLLEKENERVRFHAAQSTVVFAGLFIVSMAVNVFASSFAFAPYGGAGAIVFGLIGAVLGLVSLVIWLASLGIWLYLGIRTYQGGDPKIPGAAGIANRIP